MNRYRIYKTHNEFKKERDSRTMNEICSSTSRFELQAQQKFMKDYISKNPNWKKLLLYHQIGSGKTCTAITMAEQVMDANPLMKTIVILPARLKTNFYDELMTECALQRYMQVEEFTEYHSSDVPESVKSRIRAKFIKSVESKYDIMSFEKFKKAAQTADDIRTWVKDFTKDKLIIVDEVHNLISSDYDTKAWDTLIKTNRLQKKPHQTIKGVGTIIFKYLNEQSHETTKMLFLTATPVFNDLGQFKELVMMLNPSAVISPNATIGRIIENLRGLVSFYPGTSPNAYPSVVQETIEIPLSETQDVVTNEILTQNEDPENDDSKEAFKIFQRIASVACLPKNQKINNPDRIKRTIENLTEYAPKIELLLNRLTMLRGKHMVYSTFIQNGIDIIEAALKERGWISWQKMKGNAKNNKEYEYKVYAVWDGSVKDNEKQEIKCMVNSTSNIDGREIRCILGSPSIKEGVSFKHIQHLHVVDPVWNSSAMSQIEGRAIRFCSHIDIPLDHAYLKRQVKVHYYKSIPKSQNPIIMQTADQKIYDDIIPKKKELIESAEAALKKVSIDYYLFRKMYGDYVSPTTPSVEPSPITIEEKDDVRIDKNKRQPKEATTKNTCPKRRRPNELGRCNTGYVKRKNKNDDDCCYKEKKPKSKCPKSRRPSKDAETGQLKCEDGKTLKKNKHGDDCCFVSVRGRTVKK